MFRVKLAQSAVRSLGRIFCRNKHQRSTLPLFSLKVEKERPNRENSHRNGRESQNEQHSEVRPGARGESVSPDCMQHLSQHLHGNLSNSVIVSMCILMYRSDSYWNQIRRPHHVSRRFFTPQVRTTVLPAVVSTTPNKQRDDYIRSLWKGILSPRRGVSTMKNTQPKSSEIHHLNRNLETLTRDIPLLAPTTESLVTRSSILDFDQTMEDEKVQMLKLMNQASNGDVIAQQKISDLELSRLSDYVGHNQQLSDMFCKACAFFSDPKKCKMRFCAESSSNKTT
ncbi:hypothetical protein FSP39_003167 [Pinctada imbricata]|uniref:Uncharacterized protein n=1 Tax=Pinctada imbricata TaxID=66713 RepID=A0AA89C3K4_PINIB|nr:hypothetical protein FSP39_003167 [Pinctada imbricata]